MTMAARDTAINKFKEDPDCRVFLMSLKAGGVALNLTVASHVSVVSNSGERYMSTETCSHIGCLWKNSVRFL